MATVFNTKREEALNTISYVGEGIFVGGYLAAADGNLIKRLGITRIVKMFADDKTYPGGYHRHAGIKYLVIPADDVPNYDIRSDMISTAKFIKEGAAGGERILVHCHAGVSRSVTIVLFYLMLQGYDLDSAMALVKSKRPFIQPNAGFMQHLLATDRRIKRIRARH